jgi:alkylation response protein AidB-like acyl-CoA dehydrogenase
MKFSFNEEQEALRLTARRFLETHATSRQVRTAAMTAAGYDSEVWQKIGGGLGWTALLIPEAYGGLGASFVELTALLEELGRALLPSPFYATVCLATNTLLSAADEEQKRETLGAIAAGKLTATLAHTEPGGGLSPDAILTTARPDGEAYILNGTKAFVVDGHTADLLIVVARLAGSTGSEGIALFLVPGDAEGLKRQRQESLDTTRCLAEVRLAEVRVPRRARLCGEGATEGWAVLQRALDRACIALSAEQVGGAQRCLDMSVEYAKVRVQFGRPIGSFQAIKHKCAEMLLQVEAARSCSYYAGWAAAANSEELPLIAPLAKACCSEAYFHCAAENIQIHGGIGFTFEHDAHLYFRRAKSSEIFLGDPAHHREVLAQRMGLVPAPAS